MSKQPALSTEETILAVAESIFLQKGYAGTRMQEIADAANINKAMLHYYFRSKEKLFRQILTKAIEELNPTLMSCLTSDKDVLSKLEDLVSAHISILLERPHLPLFIVNELSQNQGKFVGDLMLSQNMQPVIFNFFQQVQEEVEAGKIRPIDPIHLMMNTMSLIVFPFVTRTMIATVTGMPDQLFEPILAQRREHVIQFLRTALQP